MKLLLVLTAILALGLLVSAQHSQPSSTGDTRGMGVQILSDTEGIDFVHYVQRLLNSLKRNWIRVMPESERKERKGVVYIIFQINPDGSLRSPDPILERSSGEKALDDAAIAAVNASTPFESLPSQFHGPYLKLRIVFIYGSGNEMLRP